MEDKTPYEGVVLDLAHQVVVMGPEKKGPETEEEWIFDDDDFWEAIDLLETCIKMFKAFQATSKMSPQRTQLLENHINDLKMFVGTFIVPELEGSK